MDDMHGRRTLIERQVDHTSPDHLIQRITLPTAGDCLFMRWLRTMGK